MKANIQRGMSLVMVVIVGALVILAAGIGFLYMQKARTAVTVKPITATLTAAGAGSALFALPNWTEYYEKKYGGAHIKILPSTDTGIGIQGLKEKTIDIAGLARTPKEAEQFPELQFVQFAKDAIVFAVHPSVVGVTSLTEKQLTGIYTGNITNWRDVGGPDAKIVVIDRTEQESAKQQIRETFLKDAMTAKTNVEITSEKDVLAALLSTHYSIGYLSYGRAKTANVVVLALDGLSVDEGMKKATYLLPRTYYIGYRTDSSEAVKDFIQFIETEGKGLAGEFNFFE